MWGAGEQSEIILVGSIPTPFVHHWRNSSVTPFQGVGTGANPVWCSHRFVSLSVHKKTYRSGYGRESASPLTNGLRQNRQEFAYPCKLVRTDIRACPFLICSVNNIFVSLREWAVGIPI